MKRDLTSLDSHFAFGENWADFARIVDDDRINAAVEGLKRLLAGVDLSGKRFLDIGCGSGLHALAALKLGAAEVFAVDLDPHSVKTARALLSQHAPGCSWRVEKRSVFDLGSPSEGTPRSDVDVGRDLSENLGTFDVVYSWGVLHHTGDMHRAIQGATGLVKEGGSFVFALYRRTLMCPLWKIEKRWYSRASQRAQSAARGVYTGLFTVGLWLTGRTMRAYNIECMKRTRGMNFEHDAHDWLGGYPYESINAEEVEALMSDLGFSRRARVVRPGLSSRIGLFGFGCDEYHYERHR